MAGDTPREDGQRLDKWLWCARLRKHRADCAALVTAGLLRINRQPTDKPHARIRPGDVLTIPGRDGVAVIRVRSLAARRGPAAEARGLFEVVEGRVTAFSRQSASDTPNPMTKDC